ncbi:hypothetical protein ACWD4J_12250 [Streptomyces sp. NPDC002577]
MNSTLTIAPRRRTPQRGPAPQWATCTCLELLSHCWGSSTTAVGEVVRFDEVVRFELLAGAAVA